MGVIISNEPLFSTGGLTVADGTTTFSADGMEGGSGGEGVGSIVCDESGTIT